MICKSSFKKKNNGFTLIELLVVIAIISLLAAILFPVFAKAREKARQTACLSNEKQLALAFQQYVTDYDEIYPQGTHPNGTFPFGVGWGGQVYPYVKSTGVYHCPDDKTQDDLTQTPPVSAVSYAYNLDIPDNSGDGVNSAAAKFLAPAQTVLLLEVRGSQADLSHNPEGSTSASPATNGLGGIVEQSFGMGGPAQFDTGILGGDPTRAAFIVTEYAGSTGRHSDGSNFALADGHCKWLPAARVSCGGMAVNPTDDQAIRAAGTQNGKWAATFSPN